MDDIHKKWTGFEPDIIPVQYEGRSLEAQRSKEFQDTDAAKMAYLIARQRLLDVNRWAQRIEGITAAFQLTDQDGVPTEGMAGKGLMIRIDIPGPGTFAGDGYDWAVIEDMEEGSTDKLDFLAFRVRPAANPAGENPSGKGGNVAHFFSEGSSGTFVLYREKNELTCTIYDRNLKPNTEIEGNLADKARNSFVGTTAAMGMSAVQWQKLADSVLEEEEGFR